MSHVFRTLLWTLCLSITISQTKIDLQTQSRSVDFSTADSTRPFKSGTALPATCAIGEMFYKTDAPSGANLFGCISLNTWAIEVQGSASGISMLAQSQDLVVARTSSTTLVVGANCSVGSPCNVRFGSLAFSLISAQRQPSAQVAEWHFSTSRLRAH
jgi:hypothetical protein